MAYNIYKITLYALGLQHLDVPQHWYSLDDQQLELVAKAFPKRYDDVAQPDLYVDARLFREWRCPNSCTGENHDFIDALVKDRRFGKWLREFKGVLDAEDRNFISGGACTIAVCCKAGINRSIGCCRVLEHVLTSSGFLVDIIWLSKPQIDRRRICYKCAHCRYGRFQTHKKACALDDAFRLWQTLC